MIYVNLTQLLCLNRYVSIRNICRESEKNQMLPNFHHQTSLTPQITDSTDVPNTKVILYVMHVNMIF
jgi:hypothetical protein